MNEPVLLRRIDPSTPDRALFDDVRVAGETARIDTNAPATLARPGAGPGGDSSMASENPSQPNGYCQCGCGEPVGLRKKDGRPARYVHGHNRRKPDPYIVADAGYETPCWLWQLSLTPKGYGKATLRGHPIRAHRLHYSLRHGELPEGLQLDHLCGNRACVNPDHLEPVTNAENSRRGRNSKITSAIAAEIRAAVAAGETQTAVARRLGLSQQTVSRIVLGEAWS